MKDALHLQGVFFYLLIREESHLSIPIIARLVGILYFIYKLWIGFVFWTSLLIMYPFFKVLLMRRDWFPAAFRLKRAWSKAFQWMLFCPVRKTLKQQLPPPPYVIASNHSSYLDTVFMYSIFPDYFLFIGKGELLKWPLFKLFFKKMDIPVERSNSKSAYQSLQKAYDAIDRGECIAIYPEGTIPDHAPRMKSFKNGAFRMAIDKQIPIVPVTWKNQYRVMKDPAKFFEFSLPQIIDVVIHPAVHTTGLKEEDTAMLRKAVFATIDSEIPQPFRADHESTQS